MTHTIIARRIEIQGIVQGVGFRPYVYTLATKYRLTGNVANTSAGVMIHVQGPPEDVAAFKGDIEKNPPPLAHVAKVSTFTAQPVPMDIFIITQSDGTSEKSALIAPDTAVCDDCRKEMFDPTDRRYRYPFINCTNCGPRYTIIDDIPYDRPHTSMRSFTMCPKCQAEYDDPQDRRFHAQPNACPVCGPHVSLMDSKHRPLETDDPVSQTINLLKDGHIVAVKGLGGFHLAVDATNETAVARLRHRKVREKKPLALMAENLEAVHQFAHVNARQATELTSRQRPIVLLSQKTPNAIALSVAPNSREFGVMLPYTPLHYLLFEKKTFILVMTSGNRSDEPIAIDNADAFERLKGIADFFLVHNRDIYLRSDDSLVRVCAEATRPLRRARGYVPVPIFLRHRVPSILAVGAALKNTICLTKDDRAFVSQHIGDLENVRTYGFFKQTIDHLTRILSIQPDMVACDRHPDYMSSTYVQQLNGIPHVAVQHHHAHIVSVMAEHRLEGPVLGLAFDGTGYGDDGHIWGGEVLVATYRDFERVAHPAYIPMPGSSAAIREPWRMAVSYLYAAMGDALWNLDIPFIRQHDANKIDAMLQLIRKKINTPLTSSIGRLFDGVAALVGIRQNVTYEGQAAMELEQMADDTDEPYSCAWEKKDDRLLIHTEEIIRDIVSDLISKKPAPTIAGRFHATLPALFGEIAAHVRRTRNIQAVVLSGGVFQNARLLAGMTQALYAQDMTVYTPISLPANDGGISFGQAMVAAAIENHKK